MKILPLQKEWEEHNKLRDEGGKLIDEGWKLLDEGVKLCNEGAELWNDAIIKYYGKNAKVTWRRWHKDNEPTCHVGSDVYV